MAEAIICPACGFDPYDMIFYAVKQEFPDSNPRDVIEEMSDEEYQEEAEFYVFENHIDYCPNQDKLMKISAGFDTEEEAFSYAYNQGHAASRKNSPYKPNPTTRDTSDFKKIYKQRAETFKAPYAGAGSLMGIGQGTGLGSFTSKELTESSAIHGDFDSASLNYSGKQNLEVRAEQGYNRMRTIDLKPVMVFFEGWARDENGVPSDDPVEEWELWSNEIDITDVSVHRATDEWWKLSWENDDGGFYDCIINPSEWDIDDLNKVMEADWRDLPRDSAGRWTSITPNENPENLDAGRWVRITPNENPETFTTNWKYIPNENPENLDDYIDIQPAQSGTFPMPVKQETFSQSQITLRELSETMNTLTGNLLGFDMAYRTVVDMLGSQDSPERREALLSTLEETIMTLEFYEETGYDGDIQMMVDIMRQNGMNPPPQFEEEVLARYQFEDKWASETEEDFIKWFEDAEGPDCYTCGDYNSLGDVEGHDNICEPCQSLWIYDESGPEGEGYYRIHTLSWDQKVHFHNAKAEGKKILKPEVPADFNIKETFGNNMVLMAEDDDEGPTIEEFFRDISKVLNKYGEFSWDSEAGEEGLYFSGMLLPHNGADNFFQYDEDFSE